MGTKKYWKGLPELTQSPEFLEQQNNEFAENLPIEEVLSNKAEKNEGTSRRDFLKFVGFSTAAVALASCETPVIKSIPYVVKPEEITPGIANFYATTFYDGYDFAPVWVKTREGRPIKIEGNELNNMTWGATSARVQASVLSLYDDARLKGPVMGGVQKSWKEVDKAIGDSLNNIKTAGQKVVLLSSTIISPSTKAVVAEFTSKFPNVQHVTYDSVSYSSLRFANNAVWGKNVVASYDFAAANVIVGIACDFLGNWLNPVEFSAQYGKTRKVSKDKLTMSKHYHFEANLSLTGANADERFPVKTSDFGKVAAQLFNEVAKLTGNSGGTAAAPSSKDASTAITKIAKELYDNKGKSVVVCGLNDNNTQILVAGINKMLENNGKTLDVDMPLNLKQGDDKAVADFIADLVGGKIAGVMFYNCNPVYTLPAEWNGGEKFAAALKNLALTVSFSQVLDETAAACKFVCPDHNFLESWGDANPKRGMFTLQQPAISPLFGIKRFTDAGMGTRQVQDTLLTWASYKSDYYTYLQAYWQNHIFGLQGSYRDFWTFWSKTLHDGGLKLAVAKDAVVAPMAVDSTGKPIVSIMSPSVVMLKDMMGNDSTEVTLNNSESNKTKVEEVVAVVPNPDYNSAMTAAAGMKSAAWEMAVYEKVTIGNGNQANNPWLQEMPDVITKVTWDNYVTMNPADVKTAGLNEMLRQDQYGSYINITVNKVTVTLPVCPTPGQAAGTMGIALGYGRSVANYKVANGVGQNAFPMLSASNGNVMNISSNVTFEKASGEHLFAGTQIHHTIMGREEQILRETKLDIYKEQDKLAFNPPVVLPTHEGDKPIGEVDLWDAHPRPGHKWALNVDLNSCIGCGACVVACTSENNVAVVGKEEVTRTRIMHWLRIDRYFTSDMDVYKANEEKVGFIDKYLKMETPSNNPKVTFQPLMCQHCNHAPCETVCPVLATNHSTEGLNQMTYNRCIGTRYCANNCPFKVRRFNWWNYNDNKKFSNFNISQTDYGRMVMNPDVVVRSRGVMEKCSMCQQRLQAGKTTAKKTGMPLKDGAIKTACQQACPTQAITFGDANDPESAITKARNDDRNYFLLEELGVKATVSYLVKVRNEAVTAEDKEEVEYRKKRYAAFDKEMKEKMEKMNKEKTEEKKES